MFVDKVIIGTNIERTDKITANNKVSHFHPTSLVIAGVFAVIVDLIELWRQINLFYT